MCHVTFNQQFLLGQVHIEVSNFYTLFSHLDKLHGSFKLKNISGDISSPDAGLCCLLGPHGTCCVIMRGNVENKILRFAESFFHGRSYSGMIFTNHLRYLVRPWTFDTNGQFFAYNLQHKRRVETVYIVLLTHISYNMSFLFNLPQ